MSLLFTEVLCTTGFYVILKNQTNTKHKYLISNLLHPTNPSYSQSIPPTLTLFHLTYFNWPLLCDLEQVTYLCVCFLIYKVGLTAAFLKVCYEESPK